MTPAVQDKFNEGKALYEGGAVELLPLLKAIQSGESITGNSAEYKALAKAIDGSNNGVPDKKSIGTNKDGFVKGQTLTQEEYQSYMNKQRAKK